MREHHHSLTHQSIRNDQSVTFKSVSVQLTFHSNLSPLTSFRYFTVFCIRLYEITRVQGDVGEENRASLQMELLASPQLSRTTIALNFSSGPINHVLFRNPGKFHRIRTLTKHPCSGFG
jgi:hypothetical protein